MNNGSSVKSAKTTGRKIADIAAIIVCLAASLFLWYYVTDLDVTVYSTTLGGVPVEIRNESGYSVLSGDDATVDVTVSGKRSAITKIEKGDITAFVTVPSDVEPGRLRCTVEYDMPNSVTFSSASTEAVYLYLDNTETVSVPVRVRVTDYQVDDPYVLDLSNITVSPATVSVTGPASVISTIDRAELVASIGHVARTVTYNGTVALLDAAGGDVVNAYIRTNVTNATATIPVLVTREIPVSVRFTQGIFNSENCKVTATPAFITVKGEAEIVDRVALEYEIDERTVENGITERTVDVSLPSGVTNVDEIDTVGITLETTNISSKRISVELRVTNPDGLSYVDPGMVLITVRGDGDAVESLQTYEVTAEINLSGRSAGTVDVPVSVSFFDKYAGKVYVVGDYSVSVRITQGDGAQ